MREHGRRRSRSRSSILRAITAGDRSTRTSGVLVDEAPDQPAARQSIDPGRFPCRPCAPADTWMHRECFHARFRGTRFASRKRALCASSSSADSASLRLQLRHLPDRSRSRPGHVKRGGADAARPCLRPALARPTRDSPSHARFSPTSAPYSTSRGRRACELLPAAPDPEARARLSWRSRRPLCTSDLPPRSSPATCGDTGGQDVDAVAQHAAAGAFQRSPEAHAKVSSCAAGRLSRRAWKLNDSFMETGTSVDDGAVARMARNNLLI